MENLLPHLPSNAAYFEDKADIQTLFRLDDMHRRCGWVSDLLESTSMVALAESLLKQDAVPQGAQLFGKAPRVGQETPAHQDGYNFKLEPNEAVTIWMPLDRTDPKMVAYVMCPARIAGACVRMAEARC